jgi:MFS family permease
LSDRREQTEGSEREETLSQDAKGRGDYAKWTILAVTTLSSFMSTFDSNVVSIALPTIGKQFGSGVSLLGWGVTAYVLAAAVTLLQIGKLGDSYGKKRIYLLGFALFGLSSAVCGTSQNIYEFIALRAAQGLSAAFMGATSGPLVYESFPARQRGIAMGTNSISWVVGALTGPVLGGLLVQIDWRLIFYVNVPIAVMGVLIGRAVIPAHLGRPAAPEARRKFNLLSSAIFGLSIGAVFVSLTFFSVAFGILGLSGLGVFVLYERRSPNPLISRELIARKGYVLCLLTMTLIQMSILAIPFILSFYYQVAGGFSPEAAGLWITPFPLFYALSNPLGGRIYDRVRVPATASLFAAVISAMAIILMGVVAPGPIDPSLIAVLLAALSLSNGVAWSPTLTSSYTFAGPSLRGLAIGTTSTFNNITLATSITMVTVILTSFLPGSTISQLYAEAQSGSLTIAQVDLLKQGAGLSLEILGCVLLLAVPILYLLAREERKPYFQDR